MEEEKGKRRDKKERSGGSGVPLGRPKGAPRGYEGHRPGTGVSKSPPPLPPQSIKDAQNKASKMLRSEEAKLLGV